MVSPSVSQFLAPSHSEKARSHGENSSDKTQDVSLLRPTRSMLPIAGCKILFDHRRIIVKKLTNFSKKFANKAINVHEACAETNACLIACLPSSEYTSLFTLIQLSSNLQV